MTLPTRATPTAEAYAEFAPFYDRYVEHPGYSSWVRRLLALAGAHGYAGGPVLDVGCGTGLSFAPLLEAGLDVVGVEPVDEMAAIAEERGRGRVEILRHDVTALPQIGSFDLVLMLNDVVNCLLDADDARAAIEAIAANMAPGGLLLFDANTVLTYRTVFGTTSCSEDDDVVFVWRGSADDSFGEGDVAEATLDVFAEAGPDWQRIRSRHVQRHHPEAELAGALASAGLRPVCRFGQDGEGARSPGPADELRDRKVVYLAQRF